MNRTLRLTAAAALLILLAACGAKGPLFLPEQPAPEEQVDPSAESAPVDTVPAPTQATDPATPPPVTPPATPTTP